MHKGPVTVNGRWPNQDPHVFSFHNPCISLSERNRARELAGKKSLKEPIRLIFVGNISQNKGFGRALKVVASIKEAGIHCKFDIVGDGTERQDYEREAQALGLQNVMRFHGWVPREDLGNFYSQGHFLVLPCVNEGFPKVLSEAMAYGVVPIAGAVSSIPQVLEETASGVAVSPVREILDFIKAPERWQRASEAGFKASGLFTYEHYVTELDKMFRATWGCSPIMLQENADRID
jgi:glycosyltransferase involved in cell wall biosynthesis